MYQNGQGVSQDYDKAMEFYLKSANQGNKDAQYSVGIHSFHSNIILTTNYFDLSRVYVSNWTGCFTGLSQSNGILSNLQIKEMHMLKTALVFTHFIQISS
jgi:TPR repeat protein